MIDDRGAERREAAGGIARRVVESGGEALELLAWEETETSPRTPILFVHGAYVGAWCWAEHFLGWFGERGHPAYAVSLRGHGRSGGRERLHAFGVEDFAGDVGSVVAGLPRPPILVGHSMGAIVVQKFLERGTAPGAAFVCPVPPTGLLPASFALAFTRPALFAEINAMAAGGRPSQRALREALFAGPLDEPTLARHAARMQGESRRALMDLSGWGLPHRWKMNLPARVVIAAERDVLIPRAQVELAARHLDAPLRVLPGLGHALMLEDDWASAAHALADWVTSLEP